MTHPHWIQEYASGDKEAARDALPLLKALQGRYAALMDKYWGSGFLPHEP
jgi:hypothetical protein